MNHFLIYKKISDIKKESETHLLGENYKNATLNEKIRTIYLEIQKTFNELDPKILKTFSSNELITIIDSINCNEHSFSDSLSSRRKNAAIYHRVELLNKIKSAISCESHLNVHFVSERYLSAPSEKPPEQEPENADFLPDILFLSYFLKSDNAIKDDGYTSDRAVSHILNYINRYVAIVNNNPLANLILDKLSKYVHRNNSLHQDFKEKIYQTLLENKYVCFSGGCDSEEDNGHTIFYELYFDTENQLLFSMTNSGEGLSHHSPFDRYHDERAKEVFYRTLTFSGITQEQFEQSKFLEILLYFIRGGHTELLSPTIKVLYETLFAAWPTPTFSCRSPSNPSYIIASNIGSAQRGNSCAVQSIVKWIKGNAALNSKFDSDRYLSHQHLMSWIKLKMVEDYLTHSKDVDKSFLTEAIQKLSSHCVKLYQTDTLSEELFEIYSNIIKRAKTIIAELKPIDFSPREPTRADGQNLIPNQFIRASCPSFHPGFFLPEIEKDNSNNYRHLRVYSELCTPEGLSELLTLSKYDITLFQAASLNFFRSLPDFDLFDQYYVEADGVVSTSKSQKKNAADHPSHPDQLNNPRNHQRAQLPLSDSEATTRQGKRKLPYNDSTANHPVQYLNSKEKESFLTKMGNLLIEMGAPLNATYIDKEIFPHLPDNFIPDLINGWLIIYNKAKKSKALSTKTLFETIEGLKKLIDAYKSEFTFNRPESSERLSTAIKFCEIELYQFTRQYSSKFNNYWSPLSNEVYCESYWSPFNLICILANKNFKQIEKINLSAFPKSAFFAAKKLSSNPEQKEDHTIDLSPERLLEAICTPLPNTPYYDILREGLSIIYLVSDRYFSVQPQPIYISHGKNINMLTNYIDSLKTACSQSIYRPGRSCSTYRNRMDKCKAIENKPEATLCSLENGELWGKDTDLNIISKIALNESISPTKAAPFKDCLSTSLWIMGVAASDKLKIAEAVAFAREHLTKLYQVPYQRALDYLFFRYDSSHQLGALLSSDDEAAMISLLFNFITTSYEELLSNSDTELNALGSHTNKVASAAYLFYLHGCILARVLQNKSPDQSKLKIFYDCWDKLLIASKNHPHLCRLLRESSFALITQLEGNPSFDHTRHLLNLTIISFIDCFTSIAAPNSFDTVELTYGYCTFKADLEMLSQEQQNSLFQKAAQFAFEEDSVVDIRWDKSKNRIALGSITLDLYKRQIIDGEHLNQTLLPSYITDHQTYKELFNLPIIANKEVDGMIESYIFKHRETQYKILFNTSDLSYKFYRYINQVFYQLDKSPASTFSFQCYYPFLDTAHFFWRKDQELYIEKKERRKIIAYQLNNYVKRVKNHNVQNLYLAYEINKNCPLAEKLYSFCANNYFIWLREDGTPDQIELCDISLNFFTSNVNVGDWYCSSIPGFKISLYTPTLCLKNVDYLFLENEMGVQKVLIRDKNCASKYHLFDIDKHEKLSPPSPVEKNYPSIVTLIILYIDNEQFEEALTIINSMGIIEKKPIKSEVIQLLRDRIKYNRSGSIRECALLIQLSYWLLNNQVKFNPFEQEKILNQWNNYRDAINQIPQYELSKQKANEFKELLQVDILIKNTTKSLTVSNHYLPIKEGDFDFEELNKIRKCVYSEYEKFIKNATENERDLEDIDFIKNKNSLNEQCKKFLIYYHMIAQKKNSFCDQLRRVLAVNQVHDVDCDSEKVYVYNIFSTLLIDALILEKEHSQDDFIHICNNQNKLINIFSVERKRTFYKQLENFYKEAYARIELKEGVNLPSFLGGPQFPVVHLSNSESYELEGPIWRTNNKQLLCYRPLKLKNQDIASPISSIEGEKLCSSEEVASQNDHSVKSLERWAISARKKYDQKNIGYSLCTNLIDGAKTVKEIEKKNKKQKILTREISAIKNTIDKYDKEISTLRSKLIDKKHVIEKSSCAYNDNKLTPLEHMGGAVPPLDLTTILIAIARKNGALILERNRSLRDSELDFLVQEAFEYVLIQSNVNQYEKCTQALKNYLAALETGDEDRLSESALSYFNYAHSRRVYDPAERPELLIFEYFNDLLLREEQVQLLDTLLTGETNHQLHEVKTGFGKSKVLLPLWLIIRSSRREPTFMVIPSALYDQQVAHFQKIFNDEFSSFATMIEFSRNSECTTELIKGIKEQIERAAARAAPILMSDRTAHNLFVLKIKEQLLDVASGGNDQLLTALLELRFFVKSHASLYIDEPHLVLDDSHESNYTVGKGELVEEERISVACTLYDKLLHLIKGKWRVIWNQSDPQLPLLTEEIYRDELCEKLMYSAADSLKIKLDDEKKKYLLSQCCSEEQLAFEKKLSEAQGDPKRSDAVTLRLLHDQLHYHLPYTLTRNPGEHYSLLDVDNERFAIPIEDARNLKIGSEFISTEQTINFTIQANLSTPFSSSFVKNYFDRLRSQAIEEIMGGAKDLKSTSAHKEWSALREDLGKEFPINFFNISTDEHTKIISAIDEKASISFCYKTVLKKLRFYRQKVVSNSHLLCDCFRKIVGATGTLAHQNVPYQFAVSRDYTSMTKALILLIKKYENRGSTTILKYSKPDSKSIIEEFPKLFPTASVAIEVGPLLRDYSHIKELAAQFLNTLPKKFHGVVVFDCEGTPCVLSRESKKLLPLEGSSLKGNSLFWVYGQKDITGTDQPLPPSAKGVILINQHTTLTELIQGMGRMRLLNDNQDIEIAIDPDSALTITRQSSTEDKDTLTLFDLLSFLLDREASLLGRENFISLNRQSHAALENDFLSRIAQNCHWEINNEIKAIAPLLKVETESSPLEKPSLTRDETDIDKAIALSKINFIKDLDKFHNAIEANSRFSQYFNTSTKDNFYFKLKSTFDAIAEKLHFPSKVQINTLDGATQSSEALIEQNREGDGLASVAKETLCDMESSTISNAHYQSYLDRHRSRPPEFRSELSSTSIDALFKHPNLSRYKPLFRLRNLSVSYNSAVTFRGEDLDIPGWCTGFVKPLHYMILDLKVGCSTLIDLAEAENLLHCPKDNEILWLNNYGPVTPISEETLKIILNANWFKEVELAAKLLDGDLQFDQRQWEFFSGWLKSVDRKLLEHFIENLLFSIRPRLKEKAGYWRIKKELENDSDLLNEVPEILKKDLKI